MIIIIIIIIVVIIIIIIITTTSGEIFLFQNLVLYVRHQNIFWLI